MKLLIRIAALFLASLLVAPAFPCTAFLVCGNGEVLFGNNEDYWNTNVRIWFVPRVKQRLGRVYLGFDNGFPQGGMNEAGLAFDGFATGRMPMKEQQGKQVFAGNLIDQVMATCSNVEEVVAFLGRHDLSTLENAMLMFADKSKDSVIIEGDEFVRKQGSFQVVTNFYQSRHINDRAMCPRFDSAVGKLEQAKQVDLALCRRVLASTVQEAGAPTQYSNVFDLKRGLIYLYHFHNFEEVVVFDLAKELKKGEHKLEIPDLFPSKFAYQRFVEKRKRDKAEATAKRRGKAVDAKILDQYSGRYAIELPGMPRIVATIRRDRKKLIASSKSDASGDKQKDVELTPQSDTVFFYIADAGTTEIRFERGGDGEVSGIEITGPTGNKYRGSRIE